MLPHRTQAYTTASYATTASITAAPYTTSIYITSARATVHARGHRPRGRHDGRLDAAEQARHVRFGSHGSDDLLGMDEPQQMSALADAFAQDIGGPAAQQQQPAAEAEPLLVGTHVKKDTVRSSTRGASSRRGPGSGCICRRPRAPSTCSSQTVIGPAVLEVGVWADPGELAGGILGLGGPNFGGSGEW
jgi:hypothetical protein